MGHGSTIRTTTHLLTHDKTMMKPCTKGKIVIAEGVNAYIVDLIDETGEKPVIRRATVFTDMMVEA